MSTEAQTDSQSFGAFLRRARERHEIPLSEIARKTKVSLSCLETLEAADLERLPAEVFVRGFIRSYARAIGISDIEPLNLFEKAVVARRAQSEVAATTVPEPAPSADLASGDDELPHRRGIGLAVFVIIVLLIATITWSIYLRQPPQSGEGLSDAGRGGDAATLMSLFLG